MSAKKGAVVRVGEKGKRSSLLRRPVQRLYPLEVQDTKTVNRNVKPEGKTDVKAEEIDSKTRRRRAAVEANEKIKLIDKFLWNLSGECEELRATKSCVWRKLYPFR